MTTSQPTGVDLAVEASAAWSGYGMAHREVWVPVLVVGTSLFLTAVRLGLFFGGRCFMRPSRPPGWGRGRSAARGAGNSRRTEDPDTDSMLRIVAQLLLDIFVHPGGLVLVVIQLVVSPLLDAGFTAWSSSMDMIMSLSLAQIVSQGLATVWKFPKCRLRTKADAWVVAFHYFMAACLYGYILYSRKAAILGMVGIISQFPLLNIRAQKLFYADICPGFHAANLTLALVLTGVLGLCVPAMLLGISSTRQNPFDVLGTVGISVFWVTLVYFTCVYMINLKNVISSICSRCGAPCPGESQPLLEGRDVLPSDDIKAPPQAITVVVHPTNSHGNI